MRQACIYIYPDHGDHGQITDASMHVHTHTCMYTLVDMADHDQDHDMQLQM
jgi:hypothetical protein